MIKKSKPVITSVIDISLFLSFVLIFLSILNDVFGSERVFSYTIGACTTFVVSVVLFLSSYFLFSKVQKLDTCFYTIFNLNDISKFLCNNNFIISAKIGDYYVYKSQTIILPSAKVFVKIDKKKNVILTHGTDVNWIKKGLEELKNKETEDKIAL